VLITAFASPNPSNAAESNFPTSGSWVVPAGVSIIQVSISAGSGGDGGDIPGSTAQGGKGLGITAGLNVAEGETVFIGLGEDGPDFANNSTPARSAFNIGAAGSYDWGSGKGGGGGGASAVAIDDTIVVIAGGGGGAGGAVDLTGGGFGSPASSGNGGNGGGGIGQDTGFSNGTYGDGGSGGSVLNGTAASTLSRTGTDGGGSGADSDTEPGFNADGGGGGAGYYGGLAGHGGDGNLQNAAGGGGGGGSSYLSSTRIPSSNNQVFSLSTTTPTGSIEYIDISTTSIPSATVNSPFTTTLAATFGAATAVDDWTVSPALPTGISLNASTGEISGTATATASGTYVFTATKFGGSSKIAARSSASLSFNVAAGPSISPASQTVTGTVNSAISATAVFTASNFTGTPAYTVTPTLPGGLTINSATGRISGTPTATSSTANYSITATAGLESATAAVAVTIAAGSSGQPSESTGGGSTTPAASPAPFPPNIIASVNGSFTWVVGIESSDQLVVNRGGPATFAIDPEVPPGLDFNAATGVLSGTSSSSIDTALFTVTATNIHGRSSVDIYITVTANQRLQAVDPAIESVRFSRGSSKMNTALKRQLDEWLQQERTGTTTLMAVVPKSGNGSTLARKRAVQIRKYLRANDAEIGSTITIMIAPKKTMTRRVLLIG